MNNSTSFSVMIIIIMVTVLMASCSGSSRSQFPVEPSMDVDLGLSGNTPLFEVTSANILGAYELTIDSDSMTAELQPSRYLSLGESWTISGKSYFDINPCQNCFKLAGLGYEDGRVVLIFSIRHPFEMGDKNKPPSARNRLDLDIFDLAMVVASKEIDSINYPLLGVNISDYLLDNSDGLTNELSNLLGSEIALPYVLVIDDSENNPPSNTFNKFEMGSSAEFEAKFPMSPGQTLSFDLFLTFGYGFSATFNQRVNPRYLNPEFNRKPAWKVIAIPPNGDSPPDLGNTWDDADNATEHDVTVKVYDWQIGANVNPDLDEDTDVYAASEVSSVSVEIPGMTSIPATVDGDSYIAGGTGMPDSPLVYTIPIANENLLPVGEYTGLVAVYDERSPLPIAEYRDYLIHTSDGGMTLEDYLIPAYVTYQTFLATVVTGEEVEPDGSLMWAKRAGGVDRYDYGEGITALSDYSMIVVGRFEGDATFGPGEPNETVLSANGRTDIFVARYNSDGNLMWVTQANGNDGFDSAYSVTTLSDNSVIVSGEFRSSTVIFGEGETNETQFTKVADRDMYVARYNPDGTLVWAKHVFSDDWVTGYRVSALSDDSFVVSGYYRHQPVTFGFGEPNETVIDSYGWWDIFIARYNPDGTLQWVKRAGGESSNYSWAVATLPDDSAVITGYFNETIVFGEGEINQTQFTSISNSDIYIAKYNPDGTLAWAKHVPCTMFSHGFAITGFSDNSFALTGTFQGTVTFGQGESNETVFTSLNSDSSDLYIARYHADGTLDWAQQMKVTTTVSGGGMTALSNDSSVITGAFWGDITFGEDEPNETVLTSDPDGLTDIFLARYSPEGTLDWAKQATGLEWDRGTAVATLPDNSIVLTGRFCSTTTFGPGEPNETVLSEPGAAFHEDIFIARFKP